MVSAMTYVQTFFRVLCQKFMNEKVQKAGYCHTSIGELVIRQNIHALNVKMKLPAFTAILGLGMTIPKTTDS